MSSSKPRPPVRVLAAGAVLTVGLAACSGPGATENPPPPPEPPPEEPPIVANPPAPDPEPQALPTWDSVESGHPEGATNPPMPVLAVRADGSECFKIWYDPRAVPMEARAKGGIVLEAGEAPPERATAVQCPEEQVREVLEHHASADD